MTARRYTKRCVATLIAVVAMLPFGVYAAAPASAGMPIDFGQFKDLAEPLKVFIFLSALAFIPALLIATTAFTRIIVVLAMLRYALGTQQTPPNVVLLSLALFLTLFAMAPVFQQIKTNAYDPYQAQSIDFEAAVENGVEPLRQFMIRQTREEDLAAILRIAKAPRPKRFADVQTLHLIPAFMLSELRTAFQAAFVIFLPFLLVDLVVASILMSLGMIMVPPASVSLPVKILLFILIDGWTLVTQMLTAGIH